MSGHSKWATIKRQKGANDAKRGQLFTKLSNAITIAVRQGGGTADPEFNFKLRLAIDRARASNVPKDNIDRAIRKASGEGSVDVAELLYEGFAPGGVAVIIETVTDNKQRTFSTVKNVFEKNGGSLGSQGAVAYMFVRRGEIVAEKNGISSDELLAKGIEANVTDMEEEGNSVYYFADPQDLQITKKGLEEQGLKIESTRLIYAPLNYVTADKSVQDKIINLVEKLEELDDVQEVYTNLTLDS